LIGTLNAPALESVYGSIASYVATTTSVAPCEGCASDNYCRDGILGCDYVATTQASLDARSKCEQAIHSVTVQGADLDLTPLAKLHHVRDELRLLGAADTGGQLRHTDALSGLKASTRYIRAGLAVGGFAHRPAHAQRPAGTERSA
jgi:hypothetical protein